MTKTKNKVKPAEYPHEFAASHPNKTWNAYNYLASLSRYIRDGIIKGDFRLIVSMPPRHGKSELISHWIPRWFLEAAPDKRIILSTYGDQFATKWGRKVRNGINESPFHKRAKLAEDKDAASNFYTEQGGGMLSAGIKGGITGEGADLMIVDDPIKNWEQAQSPGVRQKINNEFEATLNTRLEPGASVILLMTRWHTNDLAGFAHDEYDWEFLRFPAISDDDSIRNNQIDPREKAGLALCPDRYDIDDLEQTSNQLSSTMWEAMYQQTPVDEQSQTLWNYDIIRHGPEPDNSHFHTVVVAIDPAVSNNAESDETGIVAAAQKNNGKYVLLDDESQRASPTTWANSAVALYKQYNADRIVAEENQGGDMVEQMLRQVEEDVNYSSVRATKGKAIRAEPIVGLYENDKVYHCKKFDELEAQMVRYTGEKVSESPDRMDALVWALSDLSGHGKSGGRAGAW